MHCFGKFARRAHISHALRLSASATMIASRSGCWLRTLCFGSSRRKVHGARSSIPASVFRQGRRSSIRIGVHRRLTIRSSRPHVVASATCFTLRLHASAAPPRVGLTQALGGRKTFVFRRRFSCLFNRPIHCQVVAVLNCCAHFFRQSCIASERLRGALKLRMRCVRPLRKQ
jgi:hypothetical protein